MRNSYSKPFARFWRQVTLNDTQVGTFLPRVSNYLSNLVPVDSHVVDLGCGTGTNTLSLVASGFRNITAIDHSEDMLREAGQKLKDELNAGVVKLSHGDASDLQVDSAADAIICIDAVLNLLDGQDALEACFHSVYRALAPGGVFIFDMLEPARFRQWERVAYFDFPDSTIVRFGTFDERSGRAVLVFTGSVSHEGQHLKLHERIFNRVYTKDIIECLLRKANFVCEYNPLSVEVEPLRSVYQARRPN